MWEGRGGQRANDHASHLQYGVNGGLSLCDEILGRLLHVDSDTDLFGQVPPAGTFRGCTSTRGHIVSLRAAHENAF